MLRASTQSLPDSSVTFIGELSSEGKKLETDLIAGSLISVCRDGGQKQQQSPQKQENTVQLSEYYTFCLAHLAFEAHGCFQY